MIKLILPLLAVVLTPHYTYNYNEPLQESNIYAMGYNYENDNFYMSEQIGGETPDINNYIFTLSFDELLISNYEVSVQAELMFNAEKVSEFGACAIELRYNYGSSSTQVVTITFAVSYFTSQFNFGYNNRWNSTWTHNQTISGPLQYFSFSKTDIYQGSLLINFYAYKENSVKSLNDAIDQGYQDGYGDGFNQGENIGYQDGYNQGVLDGQADNFGIEPFFRSVFGVIDSIGQIEIFPNIKFYFILGIPIIFGVLAFVLNLFR